MEAIVISTLKNPHTILPSLSPPFFFRIYRKAILLSTNKKLPSSCEKKTVTLSEKKW